MGKRDMKYWDIQPIDTALFSKNAVDRYPERVRIVPVMRMIINIIAGGSGFYPRENIPSRSGKSKEAT
jgi:hypothetical protein